MAEQPKLVSTVQGASSEAISQLATEAQAAAADATVFAAEINASIQALLASLSANSVISEDDPLAQFTSASPAVASFVAALQQSIAEAKAATTQGLILSQQLQAGSITQEQFDTAIQGITLTTAQLQAATAIILPGQTQALILALASSTQLNQLQKLLSSAPVAAAATAQKLDGPANGEKDPVTPPSLSKLPGQNGGEVSQVAQLETEQTDEELGNNVDWLTKMVQIAAKIAEQNLKASAGSLLSLNPQPRIMTGARAVLRLNNKVIALCNNVQYEVSTDWQEIRGIDELIPNDLAPVSYSVKGSMSIYRVPNKSPVGQFLQQDMFRGMIWPYTTIEIRDKRTDELIVLIKRAAITSRSESFAKNQLTSTNLSFVGIGFRDESIPDVLPDKLSGSASGGGGLLDAFQAISNMVSGGDDDDDTAPTGNIPQGPLPFVGNIA